VLAEKATENGAVIAEIRTFDPGDGGSHDDLAEVDAVVTALSRAICTKTDILPAPHLLIEVLQRPLESTLLPRFAIHGAEVTRMGRVVGYSRQSKPLWLASAVQP
jgi:hypothetical protein